MYGSIPDHRTGFLGRKVRRGPARSRSTVSGRPGDPRRWRASSMRRSRTCRSSARTATPIRAGLPRTPTSPIPRSCSSSPTTTSSACCSARASPLEDLGVPRADGGAVETDGAHDLAALRRALSPVPRHAVAAVARPHVRDAVRHRRAARRPRRPTATTTRSPSSLRAGRVPAARAVRALQHRGDRDHRRRARRPALARADLQQSGWKGRVVTDLPARRRRRSRLRGLPRQSRRARRDHRLRHRHLARLSRRAPRSAAPSSASIGATATDHGHPTADTANLSRAEAAALYRACVASGEATPDEARAVPRADADRDGADERRGRPGDADPSRLAAATIRPRSSRASAATRASTSRRRTDYVRALKPLLDAVGMEPGLTIILFTLDETAYARELAPLAGVYPCLKARAALVVLRQPRRACGASAS